MNHIFRACSLFLIVILSVSCGKKKAETGFYFWQSSPDLETSDYRILDSAGTRHIYQKMFEVHWNQALKEGVPADDVDYFYGGFQDTLSAKLAADKWNLIPVVFIHPDVFKYAQKGSADKLARRVLSRSLDHIRNRMLYADYREPSAEDSAKLRSGEMHSFAKVKPVRERINEIQIDCDWTESSRDQYFEFLKALKKAAGDIQVSVTLRLYPFRYPEKAGVPPADKAVLMCYNMGDLKEQSVTNSILDKDVLESYLKPAKEYPLQLDVALPAFNWAVKYRHGQFIGLIRSSAEISAVAGASKATDKSSQLRTVTADTVIGNYFYRYGDIVKIENPDAASLGNAAGLIKQLLPGKINRIVFFDASSYHLNSYRNAIYTSVQKF